MNALLLLLVRRDCSWQLAVHLVAGLAALWLLVGTSRAPERMTRDAQTIQRVVLTTAANLAR